MCDGQKDSQTKEKENIMCTTLLLITKQFHPQTCHLIKTLHMNLENATLYLGNQWVVCAEFSYLFREEQLE